MRPPPGVPATSFDRAPLKLCGSYTSDFDPYFFVVSVRYYYYVGYDGRVPSSTFTRRATDTIDTDGWDLDLFVDLWGG